MDDKLKFRVATHADYAAVMQLHDDVYSGLDYLPVLYHDLLRTRGAFACVAELDGKVVGFSMLRPVLQGRAVLGMSERVHPAYQKRGIRARLNQYRNQRYPFPASELITTKFDLEKKGCRSDKDETLIGKDFAVTGVIDKETFQSSAAKLRMDDSHGFTIVEVTLENLDENPLQRILPDVFKTHNFWLLHSNSPEDVRNVVATHRTFTTKNRDGQCIAVSFSTTIPSKIGTRNDVYFYGNDFELLSSHLARHYGLLSQTLRTPKFGVRVYFPQSIGCELVQNHLSNHWKFQVRNDSGQTVIISKPFAR